MEPEAEARKEIDQLLESAGWTVQDFKGINLGASLGVAIREFPLSEGEADYLLFIDRKAIGAIEAKPKGTTLSGVAEQTQKYLTSSNKNIKVWQDPLPFGYESTGSETNFRDMRDPESRSRRVFAFHRPETLQDLINEPDTLRARLKKLPPLATSGLRKCQITAVTELEKSFSKGKPKALIQMATGSGKTYTAVSFIYRLIKYGKAKRILFLVDRNNLARQTRTEFQNYVTPDDGRKFTELYNVQHLSSNTIDPVCNVCITTIQRLYSMLRGDEELDSEIEEHSVFEMGGNQKPVDVKYNPQIPIEEFDIIVTDECHRSIYNVWRQVLEYFDAFTVGLTATPSKQTIGFFNQNLVMEYNHERAVADGVNVNGEVYRIQTKIGSKGSTVDAKYYVGKRNKMDRKTRWEMLDEDLAYDAKQLDRSVVAPDQIRTVARAFKEKIFTEIFPGRTEVPKTLVYAKDDSHADDIVQIIREEFGKGNDFCKKITYRTSEKPEDLISQFRTAYNPRIVVTVDMIATGTDIKPLECVLFMRDVRSRIYFEQMKGRGTRTVSATDLQGVTPDAVVKTHFVIVDAVGVCENDKTDSQPLERKPKVSFEKLVMAIAMGNRSEDNLSSLVGRLSRFSKEVSEKDRKEIELLAKRSLNQVINELLDAIDPDKQTKRAQQKFDTKIPTEAQITKATEELTKIACEPFDNPKFRDTLFETKKRNEQIIDEVSKDSVIFAGFDSESREKAMKIVESFKEFIDKNKNEITALQMIYGKPYSKRHITYEQIQQLADAIQKPPYYLTTEKVWQAYLQLEKSKVKGASPKKLLTDVISLVRFATEHAEVLEPFTLTVDQKFNEWVKKQEKLGKKFTAEQMDWLRMMKDYIGTSLSIDMEAFEYAPFYEKGGAIRANKVFGNNLGQVLEELNEVLISG